MAEFAAVLVFAVTGAMLVAGSTDLLVLFVALELMVLPGYMLAGFARRDPVLHRGRDQVLPARLVLKRDPALWPGLRLGHDRHHARGRRLRGHGHGHRRTARSQPGLAMGLAFMTAGVAFKMAAVPFHYWTPDAYQGSPTPVTAYLSVGPKIGAFAIALRLFVGALGPAQGGLAAGRDRPGRGHDDPRQPGGDHPGQRQADAGLLLDRPHRLHPGRPGGLRRRPATTGLSAILFYGAAYTFMNMGAFAVVTAVQRRPGVAQPDQHVRRAGPARPVAGGADGPLPAVADRHSAAGRLLGQGVRDPGRDPGRRLARPPWRCWP